MPNKNSAEAVSLAAIGEKLKAAREKKGVSLEQAQRQTHIHSTVLSAMESGRSDEVLTPNYVKSFLKKYSSYLGLDSDKLVSEYVHLHPNLNSGGSGLGTGRAVLNKRIDNAAARRVIKKIFLMAAGAVLIIITARAAAHFIRGFHKKPSVGKAYVQTKEPRVVPAKSSAKKTADKPQARQVSIPDSEPITLVMKVKADVYVGMKRDGALLFRRLLPKGTVETFTASERLNISIAKARSVELVLNGRPLDAGVKGTIKDLEITRKGIRVK